MLSHTCTYFIALVATIKSQILSELELDLLQGLKKLDQELENLNLVIGPTQAAINFNFTKQTEIPLSSTLSPDLTPSKVGCLLPNYCLNNGTCLNNKSRVNLFSCICQAGYQGKRCEFEINECFEILDSEKSEFTYPPKKVPKCSKNTLNCVDLKNDYFCECKPGFYGKNCQIDIDDCAWRPCEYGKCIDGPNSYSCECYDGYEGYNCDERTDVCLAQNTSNTTSTQSLCQNNGFCLNSLTKPGDYRCICYPGFSNKNCSAYNDPCLKGHCKNYAICESVEFNKYDGLLAKNRRIEMVDDILIIDEGLVRVPSYKCLCSNEFTGEDCSVKCGGEILDVAGLITSPGYPNAYKSGVSCHYYFDLSRHVSKAAAASGTSIKFRIFTFDFKNDEDGIIFYSHYDQVEKVLNKRMFDRENDGHFEIFAQKNSKNPFIGISFHSSRQSAFDDEKSLGRFVIMYEVQMGNTTQWNSNRFNSTVTSAAESNQSKSWWISKTDQDKQEKEKAYKDQLKILKTLTNIDLIKEYQDQSDMFRALSKKSTSSSNNNTHTWQLNSSTSKLSTHSTKYEISIKLPKNSKQFNFYKNLPMLSLIENVEKILKDWIDIEILNKRLNSKSILRVDIMKNRVWHNYLCNWKTAPKKFF